ncbi:MAG: ATP-dependent DNA ligase [Armatimonadota bacterium]|nr:ATP-dependent DNA ligase [Armatimonadota bacterium]MDR7534431.1 ATP-dependent DNA ligase [Armatimonadota bacterium]
MRFEEFCDLCRDLEATRSRLAKTARTAAFLRRLAPEEIPAAAAFLAGRALPASDPRALEVSWAALAEAQRAAGPPPATPTLGLLDVAGAFSDVAALSGPGSRRAKVERLRALLAQATDEERRVLQRILLGEMRIGLDEGLLQDALAQATGASPALVRRAALVRADLAAVARIALTQGPVGLEGVGVQVFVPLLPMLAEVADDLTEVFAAHGGRTALEYKYDGARVQIHRRGDVVRIWSRRQSEVTSSLPEVVTLAQRELHAREVIADGEVVAVGPEGRPLPFQDLMRRFRRVRAVDEAARAIPLVLHLFDLLWLDGRALIDEPYEARWALLERTSGGGHLARRIVPATLDEARAFLAEALAAGTEGLMAKALDSPYMPGSRGKRWLKVKPAETVDCVVVAADWGSGRRRGWLSNYHLAVRDDSGGWAPVGKTFKGLTDDEFRAMTARLQALAVADDGVTVSVRPAVVVEVAYNEIQHSPQYSSGFALRFARVVRIRDDKRPEDATPLAHLRVLYERQFEAKSRRAT